MTCSANADPVRGMALDSPSTWNIVNANQNAFSQTYGVTRPKPHGHGFEIKPRSTGLSNDLDFGQTHIRRKGEHVPVQIGLACKIIVENATVHSEIGNVREGIEGGL